MNVQKLRALLDQLPADAIVLVPASNHEYREANGHVTTALLDAKHRMWTEDYGEGSTPEAEYGKRHRVIVILKD